jgi:hypothetical protein
MATADRVGRSAHELARSLATPRTMMRTRQAGLEDVYPRLLANA